MNEIQVNNYDEGLIIEAEILSAWGPFLGPNQKLFTLAQSIIFKLEQSHYHLLETLKHSEFSKELLFQNFTDRDRRYYNFVTNCNTDAMMYALNSIMDIIKIFIIEIYSEYNLHPQKGIRYFYKLKDSVFLKEIKSIDPATYVIIDSFFELPERLYVNGYCNENKHQRAFFSPGSYYFYDFDKGEEIKGYTLKKRFSNSEDDIELSEFTPKLDKVHREKICELGKSIQCFKGMEVREIDDNNLRHLKMMSNDYFR